MSDELVKPEIDSDGDGARTVGQEIVISDFSLKAGQRHLLDNTSARFPAGKISLVIGPSGVGKSLLMRIIAGLIRADHPSIHFSGQIIARDSDQHSEPHDRSSEQAHLGVVFQSFALFDELSPRGNVEFAKSHRFSSDNVSDNGNADIDTDKLLATLKVPTDVKTSLLSGGQRQRLAIARTLAFDPPAILFDEPTSGLDPSTAEQVARMIKQTQTEHQTTSIVVTHDYQSLLPIADQVVILDPVEKTLVEVPKDQWDSVNTMLQPMAQSVNLSVDEAVGNDFVERAKRRAIDFLPFGARLLESMVLGLISLIPTWRSLKWGLRYLLHYARLVAGPTAWFYMTMAGVIIGFVTTYFIFKFLPFASYTQPLLVEELLAAMGFALFRLFIPVLATVMIAARSGAAVTADVGSKQYGNQIDALQTLGANPRTYLFSPIMISFIIGMPLLNTIAFLAARLTSLFTFCYTQPNHTPDFWYQNFHYTLHVVGEPFYFGTHWLVAKLVCCGFGIGVISYFQGRRPKYSSADVSRGVTISILWTTLFVLSVHFAFAFFEFQQLPHAQN